jgi:uncharacterized protein with HEPN domain
LKNNALYLKHILKSITDIEEFTSEGRNQFYESRLIQAAVIRNLEVIGEATKHISKDIRRLYPEMPWKQMAGLRDVLIHDYMGVDLNIVWNVVQREIPSIKKMIVIILSE